MAGLPGNVPLGYVVKDRKLLIDAAEAKTVRHIYRRYATLGSVWTLKEALDRDGIVRKLRVDRYGRATGGNPLARGALYLTPSARSNSRSITSRRSAGFMVRAWASSAGRV